MRYLEESQGLTDFSPLSGLFLFSRWLVLCSFLMFLFLQVIAIVSLIFIQLSITAFSLQTEPDIYHSRFPLLWTGNSTNNSLETLPVGSLDVVELVCSIWFVFEFVMRAVSCPSKQRFFMNVMNIVDLLAMFPLFLRWCSSMYCGKAMGFLYMMRCIRLFHIFKLMQHVFGVRVLYHTLRASVTTLCMVPLVLFICTLIFGTIIYYAEVDALDSYFTSIPSCFWWAVITLTTVGYGDMVPVTLQGKLVGFVCAMVGALLIVLPVPIIVNNFIKFSSLIKTKYSMPRKKEKNSVDVAHSSSA